MKTASSHRRAFTRTELVMGVVALSLLAILFVRAQTDPEDQARVMRIRCTSNLKQIGLAFRLWSNDHGDKFPMQYGVNKNGSREAIENGEQWRHFQVMSKELVTAKILVCPADNRVRLTNSWNLSLTNVSYFVGLDADETVPQTLLSGDRNLTNGVAPRKGVLELMDRPETGWTETIHNEQGNFALGDGSAQQSRTPQLRRQISVANSVNKIGSTRVQLPVADSPIAKK